MTVRSSLCPDAPERIEWHIRFRKMRSTGVPECVASARFSQTGSLQAKPSGTCIKVKNVISSSKPYDAI